MITYQRLNEVLNYDKVTGDFTWIEALSSSAVIGRKAGGLNSGYWRITIDGYTYFAARLAIMYVTGKYPRGSFVKYRDGNHSNLSYNNLCITAGSTSRIPQ